MRRLLYVCIDDTDEIGYAKSTGMLAQNIADYIDENFNKYSFVSRHQLLLDERINYTSHNSSMCFSAHLNAQERDDVIKFATNLLINESAKSSNPGLCVAFFDEIKDILKVINFGKRARSEFILKDEVINLAKEQNIYLKPIKNDGFGVIGALGALGLRLSKNDGRVKGKFELNADKMSVCDLLKTGFIDDVVDENFKQIAHDEVVLIKSKIKLIVKDDKATLLLKKVDENFITLDIENLRSF